jgi:hypothetical protein
MTYIRQDQADIDVSIGPDGASLVPYGDAWATVEGGNLASNDSKTRPGAMGREVSLGGPASRDDVTCTIQLDDVVLGWHKTLESMVGWGRVKVSYRFLRPNPGATGFPTTHTIVGTLKSAFLPNMDAGGNDQAFYSIVVSCDEVAA